MKKSNHGLWGGASSIGQMSWLVIGILAVTSSIVIAVVYVTQDSSTPENEQSVGPHADTESGSEIAQVNETQGTSTTEGLSDSLASLTAQSPVPVYLPGNIEIANPTESIIVRENYYSASFSLEDVTFFILGSKPTPRSEIAIEDLDIPRKPEGREYATISVSRGIWSASWLDGGGSYFIQLACKDLTNEACVGKQRLQSILESLTLVGGNETHGASTTKELSDSLASLVAQSPVPVLLPADVSIANQARMTISEHSYGASFSFESISFYIHGSSVVHLNAEDLDLPSKPPGRTAATISVSEGVWKATWVEQGASYLLKLTCQQDGSDSCDPEQHIRTLLESLTVY